MTGKVDFISPFAELPNLASPTKTHSAMHLKSLILSVTLLFAASALATAGPKVLLKTNQGEITIELDSEKAPESAKNFLAYVNDGFFNKTVFHRVMPDFMIQGGGFELKEDGTIEQKPTKAPIQNEAKNGLKNARGTVAMARTGDPHSATAQFFINHADNDNLDYPSFDGWGYAVFGKVIKGLDVVDKIAEAETTTKALKARSGDETREAPMENVPVENIVIESATVVAE
jgi:cyclophilin family peptidyl-prolyl cis-trans isomerase